MEEVPGCGGALGDRIFGFVDTDNSKNLSPAELTSFIEEFDSSQFMAGIQSFRDRCLQEFGDMDTAFKAMNSDSSLEAELSIKDWENACRSLGIGPEKPAKKGAKKGAAKKAAVK